MIIKQVNIPISRKFVHVINIECDHLESVSLFISTVYLTHLTALTTKLKSIEDTNRDVANIYIYIVV